MRLIRPKAERQRLYLLICQEYEAERLKRNIPPGKPIPGLPFFKFGEKYGVKKSTLEHWHFKDPKRKRFRQTKSTAFEIATHKRSQPQDPITPRPLAPHQLIPSGPLAGW